MDTKTVTKKGMGWHQDLPDIRDYTSEHEKIKPMLKKLNRAASAAAATLPASEFIYYGITPTDGTLKINEH